MAAAALAHAASSVLIWPLSPSIEAGQRAAALWLQNVGTQPVVLQVRVLAWDQSDGADRHAQQAEIVGTPPFTTLAPGAKQLIRLTAMQPAVPGRERAYRVLVDEIPAARPHRAEPETLETAQAGLRFQMRDSLPLFVYGEGLRPGDAMLDGQARADRALAAQPRLAWRITRIDGRPHLQVANHGLGHARLSRVSLLTDRGEQLVAAGLLGYVLPGKEMRWPLPQMPDFEAAGARLRVQLASHLPPMEIPMDAAPAVTAH